MAGTGDEVSMERPRVMHLVVGGDIGGAERLLVELATRPEASGAEHEVALITPNPALGDLFARAGLLVHDRGRSRESPLAYLRRSLGRADAAWLTEALVARGADVLHTHTFGSHVLGTRAALRAGVPQLRTEHHVMHYFDPSSSAFTRWAAARTTSFVAVSEHVKRVLQRAAPDVARRTTVVRNGVDASRFRPRPRSAPDRFTAGIVGRLTGWKRVDLAVRAAALADVQLVVVGDGERRASLEALARRVRARAHFVGRQDDVRPFVAACDVTINASEDEPLGLSALESLAMARPVIAYARGGIPEIVLHEVTGWLVDAPGPAPLAAALLRARDLRARLGPMGERGRAFVTTEATVEAMCRGYAAEYARLGRGA